MDDVLRQKYRASFPDKISQLKTALAEDNRQVLTQKIHQLAGSSGSYGLADLAACCAAIEERLMSVELSSAELQAEVQPLLDMMSRLSATESS